MDQRQLALKQWLGSRLPQQGVTLSPGWRLLPVSGDASFRRYFRVIDGGRSWIAVDAPPDKEDSRPFVAIAKAWLPLEIHCPEVFDFDFDNGFMLLSDLGDVLYLDRLTTDNADRLYGQALSTLVHIQQCRRVDGCPLPPYDRALLEREMALFRDWFIGRLLAVELSPTERQLLGQGFELLTLSALEQPRVCVHRDFHSRNLMVTDQEAPGVIDFQDAVDGPVTYDLVSLLRDCYIAWPREQVESWALPFLHRVIEAGIIPPASDRQLLRWFDLMGMQRHLKAVGIFSRLHLRDGKPDYLGDIPRTFGYLLEVSGGYPELEDFHRLLRRLLPAMAATGLFPAASLDGLR